MRLQRVQHFARGFSGEWMPKIRRDLGQRLQHKTALRDARMRHFQLRRSNHGASVEQNIDIDIARALRSDTPSAHLALDFPRTRASNCSGNKLVSISTAAFKNHG